MSRRDFLLGAAAGLAAGVPATWWAAHQGKGAWHAFADLRADNKDPGYAMPGRYPGRVLEVRHPQAVDPNNAIDAGTVQQMIDHGMAELVGNPDPTDIAGTWKTFFQKGDVVGIKVNPVGRKPLAKLDGNSRVAQAAGSISSLPVLHRVVMCLRRAGIPPQDIIVFERYADEFENAGYKDFMATRDMEGVRWMASSSRYSDTQLDIHGFDDGRDSNTPELIKHVAGYDPDVFTTMGYCQSSHSRHDDRRFRSHLSTIVTRLCNKIITLPVLKDHRSAGVTLALKNMSHGMNNNVARSHLSGIAHGFFDGPQEINGPNQCGTFIPQAVAHHVLRQKATLHILDGLIGVYEGGPGCWNKTWATWRHKGLLFATDPVAMDHVGWNIIDAKRVAEGWAPVAKMGKVNEGPAVTLQRQLATLAAASPAEALTLSAGARNLQDGAASEVFNLRQPEHIILAGQLGLGLFERDLIVHRRIELQ